MSVRRLHFPMQFQINHGTTCVIPLPRQLRQEFERTRPHVSLGTRSGYNSLPGGTPCSGTWGTTWDGTKHFGCPTDTLLRPDMNLWIKSPTNDFLLLGTWGTSVATISYLHRYSPYAGSGLARHRWIAYTLVTTKLWTGRRHLPIPYSAMITPQRRLPTR